MGILVVGAIFLAFAGYSLSREGARERTRMTWENSSDPGPLDFMIWSEEGTDLQCCTTACFDPPTGSFVFFRVPTIGFGWSVMTSSIVLAILAGFFFVRGRSPSRREGQQNL